MFSKNEIRRVVSQTQIDIRSIFLMMYSKEGSKLCYDENESLFLCWVTYIVNDTRATYEIGKVKSITQCNAFDRSSVAGPRRESRDVRPNPLEKIKPYQLG